MQIFTSYKYPEHDQISDIHFECLQDQRTSVLGGLWLDIYLQLVFVVLFHMIQQCLLTHAQCCTAKTLMVLQPPWGLLLPLLSAACFLTHAVPGQPFNLGLLERVAWLLLSQSLRKLTLTRSQHCAALHSGLGRIAPPQLGRQLRSGHGRAPGMASS